MRRLANLRRLTSSRSWPWVVTAICAGLAFLVTWRYFSHPTIRLGDGEVVRDLSVAEIGPLADNRYEGLRRQYFENLREYRKLPITPAGKDVAATAHRTRDVVTPSLGADKRNQPALQELPPGALDSLFDALALVMHNAAGLDEAEYVRLAGISSFNVPANLDREIYGDLLDASLAADPARVRKAFEETYQQVNTHDDGASVVSGWSLAPDGFRIALAPASANQQYDNPLLSRIAGPQEEFFRGHLSKGALVFGQAGPPWSELSEKFRSIVRCDFVIIVEDRGGDRYPLWAQLFFDPTGGRWRIAMVSRQVSLRAGAAPPLVY